MRNRAHALLRLESSRLMESEQRTATFGRCEQGGEEAISVGFAYQVFTIGEGGLHVRCGRQVAEPSSSADVGGLQGFDRVPLS